MKKKLSTVKQEKMSDVEDHAVFTLIDLFADYLEKECGYTHHRVSTTNDLPMVLNAERGFYRPAAAILPAAWKHYFHTHLADTHDINYLWAVSHRLDEVLGRLPVTVRTVFKPMRGEFVGKFSDRVMPLKGEEWLNEVNLWKPYILADNNADPFNEPEFDPFGELDYEEWLEVHSNSRHNTANGWLSEYFDRLLPNADERKIVVQWLAHIIQRPDKKMVWHVVMPSEQGTGKGFLFHRILNPLTSGQCGQAKKYSEVTGEHCTMNADCLLVMVDDAVPSDNQNRQMKSYMTEPHTQINRKYQLPEYVPSYARYLSAYNPDDTEAPEIPLGDRRLYVVTELRHKVSRDETASFLEEFSNWIEMDEKPRMDAIWRWFNNIDLSDFPENRCPPATEAKLKLMGGSVPELGDSLSSWLMEMRPDVFEELDFKKAYRYPYKPKAFKEAITFSGYEAHRVQAPILREAGYEGTAPTIYVKVGAFRKVADASRIFHLRIR